MHLLASPYDCPFVIMQQLNNIPTDEIFFTFDMRVLLKWGAGKAQSI
jgi:hypothetical protein